MSGIEALTKAILNADALTKAEAKIVKLEAQVKELKARNAKLVWQNFIALATLSGGACFLFMIAFVWR